MAEPDRTPPGIGEGLRRAHLAAERTYLAWWRTALATVAVALAIGRLLPEVLDAGSTWPYVAVGVGWGVVAVGISIYAPLRQRSLRRAIDEGAYAHPHPAMLAGVGVAGVILVAASALLVAVGP
jgi:uncharacterized membrane protein YidH (DUF202 family)